MIDGWYCLKCDDGPILCSSCSQPEVLRNASSVTCTCGEKCIPWTQPLAVPEPCEIEKLPEIVTVVDDTGIVRCSPEATLNCFGVLDLDSCRWCTTVNPYRMRYVAGLGK
jgi:hypothetical protein